MTLAGHRSHTNWAEAKWAAKKKEQKKEKKKKKCLRMAGRIISGANSSRSPPLNATQMSPGHLGVKHKRTTIRLCGGLSMKARRPPSEEEH